MALSPKEQHLQFDKRLADRHLRSGQIADAEWNQHLSGLKDLAAEAEALPPYDEPEEEEGQGPKFEAVIG